MDPKFAVDLRNYATVPVECPDCHALYQLRLRRAYSALSEKVNNRISMRCPECSKAYCAKH